MEAIVQALQQAGFEVEATETDGKNTAITLVKDGMRGSLTVPLSISAYGITEAVQWIETKRIQASKAGKPEE